ncbi:MAG: hypothetical protein AAFO82_07425 [Bacteroidota bacterium]
MKKLSMLILLLCCSTFLLSQEVSNFSKTEQSIIVVIEQETDGFWERDFNKWSDTWSHSDMVSWSGTTNEYHQELNGWKDLSAFVKKSFKDYPSMNTSPVKRMNWKFQINKNMAWVRFDQDSDVVTSEIRILEKKGGKWKLVHVGWINESSFDEALAEGEE